MEGKVYYIVDGPITYKRPLVYQRVPGDRAASNNNLVYTLQQVGDKYLTPQHKQFGFDVLLQDGSEFVAVEQDEEIPENSTIKLVAKTADSISNELAAQRKHFLHISFYKKILY